MEDSFTKQMRKATREVHALSDALVNAKLFFALTDNEVWAEGLLIFYEIFRFLEEAKRVHRNENLGHLLLDDLERTDAFEKDLEFYYGKNWSQQYVVRDAVAQYLLHLQQLQEKDPDMLMAYVYHLYMGLLSGGQILTKKRQLKSRLWRQDVNSDGYNITNFGDATIYALKRNLRQQMEDIASTLSEKKKEQLIEESKKVFEWNNKIIRTVKGTTRILVEKLVFVCVIITSLFLLFRYLIV